MGNNKTWRIFTPQNQAHSWQMNANSKNCKAGRHKNKMKYGQNMSSTPVFLALLALQICKNYAVDTCTQLQKLIRV